MKKPTKITCFGDSLTIGYIPMLESRIQEELPELNAVVVRAAGGGETSAEGLKRLPALVAERPQVVFISFGMNDLAKGQTTLELARNLGEMITAFEAIGSRVLLLTLNPVRGGPTQYQRLVSSNYDEAGQVPQEGLVSTGAWYRGARGIRDVAAVLRTF